MRTINLRALTGLQQLTVAVAITIVTSGAFGLSLGKSFASDTADQQAEVQLANENRIQSSLDPAQGSADIVTDQDGLICVKANSTGGVGSACTTSAASDPMLLTTGSAGNGVHVIVVDPQSRLGTMLMEANGRQVTAETRDAGFSIEAVVSDTPTDVAILTPGGDMLSQHQPATKAQEMRDQAVEAGND